MMSRTSRDTVLVVTLILGPALASAQDARATTELQASAELVVAWPDPALQWNAVAQAVAGGKDPVTQQRSLAIVHLAVFDAVNATAGDYGPYFDSIPAMPGASAEAAAVAAAHAVLLELVPEQAAILAGAKASSLARIPDGVAKDLGIALGDAAARATIDHRLSDGFETPEFHQRRPPNQATGSSHPAALPKAACLCTCETRSRSASSAAISSGRILLPRSRADDTRGTSTR
jgi:hypothetical protein